MLREVEVEVGRGKTVAESVKKIGVTEQTYYRWKKQYGGLRIDQAKRLKDLEKENSRLKRLLADAELDSGVSGGRPGMTEGMHSQLLSPAKRQRAVEQTRAALGRDRMTTGVNVGHARCWVSIGTRSDGRGMFRMMSPVW